jgi:hypothetical protein
MKPSDKADFTGALEAVYALYRVDISAPVAAMWWRALQAYEIAAVVDALGRHAMNPDTGQFLPKPADVVKVIEGSTADTALLAWAKALGGIKQHGTYDSVVFDDPIIHRVLEDLGGWPWLGHQDVKELPFIERRFRDAYRAHRARGLAEYPRRLAGIIEHTNGSAGFAGANVRTKFIGDPAKAKLVLEGPKENQPLEHREAAA